MWLDGTGVNAPEDVGLRLPPMAMRDVPGTVGASQNERGVWRRAVTHFCVFACVKRAPRVTYCHLLTHLPIRIFNILVVSRIPKLWRPS